MRSPLRFVVVGMLVALGCGGGDRAAPPSVAPATSTTSMPSTAPTDATPAPATASAASTTTAAPPTTATTTAPTTTASATPAPVALPARYVDALTALKASVDKVTAAIKAAKDCNGVADAMNAFTNDPRTPKQISTYLSELSLLMPDQLKVALAQSGDFTSKLTTIGIDRSECTKTPRMKAALKAMSAMETSAMMDGGSVTPKK
jgi:hypothetical protein